MLTKISTYEKMYKIIQLQCPHKSHILSTLQYCSPKLYYLNKFTYNVQVKTYLSTSKQMFNKFEDNSYISVYFYTNVPLNSLALLYTPPRDVGELQLEGGGKRGKRKESFSPGPQLSFN